MSAKKDADWEDWRQNLHATDAAIEKVADWVTDWAPNDIKTFDEFERVIVDKVRTEMRAAKEAVVQRERERKGAK